MNPRQKSKITSRHPHKNGSVQPEFHGMPVGRHETLAVMGWLFYYYTTKIFSFRLFNEFIS